MVEVCILNRRHPHPWIPGREYSIVCREYSIVYREYAAAFLSRRHLPSGIGCHTVAQTPKLDPAKKHQKLVTGRRNTKTGLSDLVQDLLRRFLSAAIWSNFLITNTI